MFHSAAYVEDWGDPRTFERVNVEGTRNVLQAAGAAGVSTFVQVSSEAVLIGGPPLHGADESWPLPERPFGH